MKMERMLLYEHIDLNYGIVASGNQLGKENQEKRSQSSK